MGHQTLHGTDKTGKAKWSLSRSATSNVMHIIDAINVFNVFNGFLFCEVFLFFLTFIENFIEKFDEHS